MLGVLSFAITVGMSSAWRLGHLSRTSVSRMMAVSAAISTPVRVRFAPSPTGSLHVGGARTALFNWLLAKKTNGKFIIRVEDTDVERSTRASEESILSDLSWMNMNWDEGPVVDGPYGPYRQSERKDIYKECADKLIETGHAYRCFCTEEELDQKRAVAEAADGDTKYDGTWRDRDASEIKKMLDEGHPYTVRFRVPPGKMVEIDDIVRGHVSWDADASLGDYIIMRSSGMPVYNFCVAVDDAQMGITHVVRAEEHLSNTPKQLLVLEALGYRPPQYAHCSLILGQDRSKLSKRHGATSVSQFSTMGYLPDAMMNYLANLGWNDGTNKEIYSPAELISAFDLSRIIKSAAIFDMDKLNWINGQHIRNSSPDILQPLVAKVLRTAETPILRAEDSDQVSHFVILATKIAQKDMELTVDARRLVGNCLGYPLAATIADDEHVAEVLADGFKEVAAAIVRDYKSGKLPTGAEDTLAELWKAYIKELGKDLGRKGKGLFHPVRLALTGSMNGPDIGDQLRLIHAARNAVPEEYPLVPLDVRMKQLEEYIASS
jgi:glutamyl-tRNA synthetase